MQTNITVAKEKEQNLKAQIAEILADSFPGKSENWLMLRFTDEERMYFAGNDAPCAMLRVALFGKASAASYDKMTDAVCSLLEKELGIPANRVYVKYEEVSHWGWNNSNF